MKALAAFTLLAMAGAAFAQEEATEPSPKPGLKPGSGVKLGAIAAAEWIQGTAPEAWEKDKVYVIDCWATWCGPCTVAIPHLNGLHAKYSEKGLRVLAMNVWEDDKGKVVAFLKKRAAAMSYPVAYTGLGSAFESDWLKAAAINRIPNAFVVKNGKLLVVTHPMRLEAEVVEALLEGGEAETKAVENILDQAEAGKRTSSLLNAFRTALRKGDQEAMASAIADLEKLDPEAPYLSQMRLDHAIAKKDWESSKALIDEFAKTPAAAQVLNSIALRCDNDPDSMPDELKQIVASRLAEAVDGKQTSATLLVVLARLQWTTGDKEAALATAKTAADNPGDLPPGPFQRFHQSVEAGEPVETRKVFGWLQEKMAGQQKR